MKIPTTTWDAIIALLSPEYPELTKEDLKDAIEAATKEKFEYITTAEACSMLKCSRMTVWRLAKRGVIRVCHPIDGKTLYCLGDVRKLLVV